MNGTQKIAYTEGWLSIFVNIILFILKYWAGIASGSLAIITDAWHSLSDSVSSVVVILGTKFASKPADEKHPFGHGRIETVTALFIGAFLLVIAFNFFYDAIERFNSEDKHNYGAFAIWVTIVAIVMKELSAQYALWASRKTGLLSLKADAWHHRSDAISSVVIIIGIILDDYIPRIDVILTILVSLLISYSAYSIIKEAINAILGTAPENDFIKQFTEFANKIAGFDLSVHHIHIHNYGMYKEITFHICLPGEMKIKEASIIHKKLNREVKKKFNMEATIHTDKK